VWSELVRERYGTERRENLLLRATGVSAARCFTKEEPEINLVRGAYSALGCALGGVQGMWISGYDEAYATPTERASRLALRTMQILAEETGVRATIDPLAGGYFVEHLTKLMAEQIREHAREVEENGGAVAATSSGFLRRRMLENDLRWAHEREQGERPIVAHNIHRLPDEAESHEVEFQRFRQDVVDDQLRRLHGVRATRDKSEVERTLAVVGTAAAQGENVMPAIVQAVRAYCTVGEIMARLRVVHGEWTEPAL
jgi:methylmalonyl-CoA mutase N-terminal domain/subunit